MNADEMNKLTLELLQELETCTVEELNELRVIWKSEFVCLGPRQYLINHCNKIIDLVIDRKLEKLSGEEGKHYEVSGR